MEAHVPQRILVWLPNWIGDAVMATPALLALRAHFAAGRLALVGRTAVLELLDGLELGPAVEWIADRSGATPRLHHAIALVRRLRRGRFDLGVMLPNSFRSACLARLGGVANLAGYARDGRGWLLRQPLQPPRSADGSLRPYSAIDYYRDLAAMLGAAAPSRRMVLAATAAGEERAGRILAESGYDPARPLVMLNPGGAFGPSKMWPAERYGQVADELTQRRGAQIVINCSPSERATALAVAAAMRTKPMLTFASRANSLSLLKSLVRRCALVVTNDTGVRHVAAALDVPTVTIFGSTDPQWAQIDAPRERIVRAAVPCAPCQRKRCPNPKGATFHQCMTAVTTDMVLQAADELLDSKGAA